MQREVIMPAKRSKRGKGNRGGSGLPVEGPMTRRKFIKKAGTFLLSTAAVGIGLARPESLLATVTVPREITIGTFGPSHCAATFVATKLNGFFREEKLNVNLVNYPDMPMIAKDLASGKLDFGQLIVPLAFAMHTGSKPFATTIPVVIPQIAGTNGAALMVRKGSNILKPSDFKGRTVASHNRLSVNYLINMMFLDANGLDYQTDVNFKMIELDKVMEAMRTGQVDAFVMPEPMDAMVEQNGVGKVHLLSKYLWPNHPCCALVCKKDFFDKNTELVASVTRMMTKGGLSINEPDARGTTINLLRSTPSYRYDTVPKEVLEKAFTPGRSDFYPFPYQSSALVIIEIMKRYGLLPETVENSKLAREVFLSDFSRKRMHEIGAKPPENDFRVEKILGKIKTFS
jgi:nitrate/nitrite transport system substrate-binding protein